jgi:hypothetical protein
MVRAKLVCIVMALFGLTLTSIARAHEIAAPHGNDFAINHATYYAPHVGHYLDACDHEPDGNRVNAEGKFVGDTISFGTPWDPTGGDPGCSHTWLSTCCRLEWHRAVEIFISHGDARWHY